MEKVQLSPAAATHIDHAAPALREAAASLHATNQSLRAALRNLGNDALAATVEAQIEANSALASRLGVEAGKLQIRDLQMQQARQDMAAAQARLDGYTYPYTKKETRAMSGIQDTINACKATLARLQAA